MLNAIFVALIAASLAIAAAGGRMEALAAAWKADAKAAVELVIGLVGFMVLWLGLMRVLREAGAMAGIARALAPLMRRLFPDVPAEHPAMAAMTGKIRIEGDLMKAMKLEGLLRGSIVAGE